MDDSPTIKTTLLCNVEEQKWRVWLATQFRKWGTNYEYICTRMQHLTWTRPNKHEDEPKTTRVVNARGEYKQTHEWKYCTGQKDSNMLCYATAERSAKGTYYNADEMIAQLTQCIHIRGQEKLCLRSRQPTRELVREERKRISEMERLESKLDRSDRACQLRWSHRRSYSCTQPEIQSNLLQSIICEIGNHPQDCSTGITTQIHARGKLK